jgi:CSLREA domain-containing protein
MVVSLLGVLASLLLFSGGRPARAATITVDTTADELNVDGDCSLREAIQAANTDSAVDACTGGSGADTIVVSAGTYTLSIAGAGEDANATGDLDITTVLTINGAGAATTVIDGAGLDRVFHILAGTVELSGLTMQNGSAPDYEGGGGVRNDGTLLLQSCTVSGNRTGYDGTGGGIYNAAGATLALNSTTVSGNSANVHVAAGGGIYNAGTLDLTDSTVSGNLGGTGGGIFSDAATLTLNNSRITNNTPGGAGGGIRKDSGGALTVNNSTISGNGQASVGGGIYDNSGMLTVNNSTITGNWAYHSGGGIHSDGGMLTLNDSTISGNTVTHGGVGWSGGGIYTAFEATATLTNVTVSDNSAVDPGGGIQNDSDGIVTVKNTIVADNSADDCAGSITSADHNLDSDSTCSLTAPGDLPGVSPLLGPLADNGGPTRTHALLAGSPAINAGSGDCPPPDSDQRGVTRPQGPACDIGAYEVSYPVGGIAEDAPLEAEAASSGHGSSAPNAAVLSGLAAGCALVLGMGVWYVRRRWLR